MNDELDELFNGKTEVRITFRNAIILHTFRDPAPHEWIEYQRRASTFILRNKHATATEQSLGARIWLYDTIAEKAEMVEENGETGERLIPIPEFKNKIPPMVKDGAVIAFLDQVRLADDD